MIDPTIIALVAQLKLAEPVPINLRHAECLADAIYHEARSEPLAAQVGVASVVLARGKPCRVLRDRSQFTYRSRPRREAAAWRQAAEVAVLVSAGLVARYDVDHFHDTSVDPKWTRKMTFQGQAGRMKFWRSS